MSRKPEQTLDELVERTRRMAATRPTSPLFWRVGWPLLGVAFVFWLAEALTPGTQFLLIILSTALLGLGVLSIVLSFLSAHSEGVEELERERRIRERSTKARCLYLEGSVPDGKGKVGRCSLYQFDMLDLPYCLYCTEYTELKGSPKV